MIAIPMGATPAPMTSNADSLTPSTRRSPDEGGGDVHAAVRRVDPAARGRVQGQEPDEKREARRGGQQEPDRAIPAQPQVGEKAAEDLRERGGDEQERGFQQSPAHQWRCPWCASGACGCRCPENRRAPKNGVIKKKLRSNVGACHDRDFSATLPMRQPVQHRQHQQRE
jgi:hypothetical protein